MSQGFQNLALHPQRAFRSLYETNHITPKPNLLFKLN